MLSPFHPLQLTLGLIVWALYFVLLYTVLSVACQHFTPPQADGAFTWLNIALLAVTATVTLGLLYQAWRGWRAIALTKTQRQSKTQPQVPATPGAPQFINYIGIAVYIVAALATTLTGIPALVLTPCI